MANDTDLVIAPEQLNLKLQVAAEDEINGVGMGVFNDGTPFLTLRGLSRMCGVDIGPIVRITAAWQEVPLKPRESKIRELVRAQGADDTIAFIATMKNGTIHHAVPAAVCMAVLEYYAFESRGYNDQAAKSFRILARKGFTDFIYSQVGYNPTGSSDIAWQQFHDRVALSYHVVPAGYFSVFKEIADMLVTLIRKGASIGDKFIPDISVGIFWGRHWEKENLDVIYGNRIKFLQNYPIYFPQAARNPHEPWCYPDEALGEFRKWVREFYIPQRMPVYLNDKVREGKIEAPAALAAIEAFRGPPSIPTRR